MDSIKTEEYLKEKYPGSSDKLSIVLLDGDSELSTIHKVLDLERLQGMSIVRANSLDSLYNAVSEHKPDIVILHIVSSEINWINLIMRIKKVDSGINIIAYSSYLERKFVLKVMGAGASGYVVETGNPGDMLQALAIVDNHGIFLSSEILEGSDSHHKIPAFVNNDISILTDRECEVIRMIGEGLSTKEIAFDLSISSKTVATYRERIMKKLNIYNIAGLIKFAINAGLTDLS